MLRTLCHKERKRPQELKTGQTGMPLGGLGTSRAVLPTGGLPCCSKEEVGLKHWQDKATGENEAGSSRRKLDVVTSAHDLERLKTKRMSVDSRQGV